MAHTQSVLLFNDSCVRCWTLTRSSKNFSLAHTSWAMAKRRRLQKSFNLYDSIIKTYIFVAFVARSVSFSSFNMCVRTEMAALSPFILRHLFLAVKRCFFCSLFCFYNFYTVNDISFLVLMYDYLLLVVAFGKIKRTTRTTVPRSVKQTMRSPLCL